MKYTLSKFDFMDGMRKFTDFSYEGLEILFDYLTEYEESTGQEIDFDPVAFRCEFVESTFEEIIEEHGVAVSDGATEAERRKMVIDYLNKNTIVLGITKQGTVVYQNF